MSARRYGHGDKVVIVVEATVQYYDEEFGEAVVQVHIPGPDEGGDGYFLTLPADWVAARFHRAGEVETQYGARYRTTDGGHLHDCETGDERAQHKHVNPPANVRAAREAARIAVSPITRIVTSWVENGGQS